MSSKSNGPSECGLNVSTTEKIRRNIIKMIWSAGSGHPGGSLSLVEILCALAHGTPRWGSVDSEHTVDLILSKGHGCPALYATAMTNGLLDESELWSFRQINSRLQGHPHITALPWVGASTGSLGQGFSVGLGKALGSSISGLNKHIFVVVGDGELQEGQIWECAMAAAHHNVHNLTAIVDYNKMQSDNLNSVICDIEPLSFKWQSFGWRVIEVDGHDLESLDESYENAMGYQDSPTVIIAHTVKGQGVKSMEAKPESHGSLKLTDAQFTAAMNDLGADPIEIQSIIQERGKRC